jgi:hypothetical protein
VRLVTRLVAPLIVDFSASRRLVVDYPASRRLIINNSASRRLVVDYSASRRLVVDYFASATRLGASTRRAARHAVRRAARRRLLRLAQAPSTTSPPPCVRVPRHVVRLVAQLVIDFSASRRLVVDNSASRRLVVDYFTYAARLGASARHASHLLSSTTSPTSRDRVPRHVARFIACR